MKEKKPGDHIILRLKNNESSWILDWINNQSNLSDAIRYLIEEEIKTNSVRDLQEVIPAKRRPVFAGEEVAAAVDESTVQREDKQFKEPPQSETEDPKSQPNVQAQPVATETKQEVQLKSDSQLRNGDEPDTETVSVPVSEPAQGTEKEEKQNSQDLESDVVSASKPDHQTEDEEQEFSDEIINHWLNI